MSPGHLPKEFPIHIANPNQLPTQTFNPKTKGRVQRSNGEPDMVSATHGEI